MISYQIDSGKKQQREEYLVNEPASSQGYAGNFVKDEETTENKNKSLGSDRPEFVDIPKIAMPELDDLIEYVKFKSFSDDLLFGLMEDLIDEIDRTIESGGNISENNIVKLLENARELPNPLAEKTYSTVLKHHSEIDSPLTGEQLLDLYEVQTYAEQRGFREIRIQSNILVEEAKPENPKMPAREVDTTKVEDMTVSEARENLSKYRKSKEPVKEEYEELVEDSIRQYVTDFEGHIRPD